jgi:GDP/UDP-N,N'-diacetylbacillosamine 2-epimerase (hydrolysing)
MKRRRVCFVTGTRAEFGLMTSTLEAIARHRRLQLQLVVTGVHLDRSRGYTIADVRRSGLAIDDVVRWKPASTAALLAKETGLAIGRLAGAFDRLDPDVVMVVGDRVEAFAAASAAMIGGRAVAHVHGGDRATGLVDDSLRHAITKLAHIHFPATRQSAKRIEMLGERRDRIHVVGAPGLDGIVDDADHNSAERLGVDEPFVLLLLHPTDGNPSAEHRRAGVIARAIGRSWEGPVIVIAPNNDPGSEGIFRRWSTRRGNWLRVMHADRRTFLGLLATCELLVGNSSSGIIEAASFGTPVVDVGDRQHGRERGENVCHSTFKFDSICKAIRSCLSAGRGRTSDNIYGDGTAGRRIAKVLATVELSPAGLRKTICY